MRCLAEVYKSANLLKVQQFKFLTYGLQSYIRHGKINDRQFAQNTDFPTYKKPRVMTSLDPKAMAHNYGLERKLSVIIDNYLCVLILVGSDFSHDFHKIEVDSILFT